MKSLTKSDRELVALFRETFSDSEGPEEGALIGHLVEELLTTTPDNDIFVFSKWRNATPVACVIYTRIRFRQDRINAFILSPAAVKTEYQGKGIGQELIRKAHKELKKEHADLLFTYGDINFYSKTGYHIISETLIEAPHKLSYPEGWLAQSLSGKTIPHIPGETYCVSALSKPEYW